MAGESRARRGAGQGRPEAGLQRHRVRALRPRHRGLPDGATPDLLRRSSGQNLSLQQDVGDGGPAHRGRVLSDRARGSAVRRRQDDLVPPAPFAGQAEGAVRDLRAGHGPDERSLHQGAQQHRHSARHARPVHGRPGAGLVQHAEDPRGGRRLRARGRGRDGLPAEAARGRQQAHRRLRHLHGQLLVVATGQLRPSRGGDCFRRGVLQSEQHDLHRVRARASSRCSCTWPA